MSQEGEPQRRDMSKLVEELPVPYVQLAEDLGRIFLLNPDSFYHAYGQWLLSEEGKKALISPREYAFEVLLPKEPIDIWHDPSDTPERRSLDGEAKKDLEELWKEAYAHLEHIISLRGT